VSRKKNVALHLGTHPSDYPIFIGMPNIRQSTEYSANKLMYARRDDVKSGFGIHLIPHSQMKPSRSGDEATSASRLPNVIAWFTSVSKSGEKMHGKKRLNPKISVLVAVMLVSGARTPDRSFRTSVQTQVTG